MQNYIVRAMHIDDYDAVLALWNASLTSVRPLEDSRESIARYLQRNPGLSVVAQCEGNIVGTILCGHDGRRGFLYHVAVCETMRRQGVAQTMLNACIAGLRSEGINKFSLVAFKHNQLGNAFWGSQGVHIREDLNYRDCWITEE